MHKCQHCAKVIVQLNILNMYVSESFFEECKQFPKTVSLFDVKSYTDC